MPRRRRDLSPCERAILALFTDGVICSADDARTMAFVGGEALRAYAEGVVDQCADTYASLGDGGLAARLVPAAVATADFTLIARAIIGGMTERDA